MRTTLSALRLAVVGTAATAAVLAGALPASASTVSGTGRCADVTSASGTQRVSACAYFEWRDYRGGTPYKYRAVGSLATSRNAGSSRLTVRAVRVQKYQYGKAGSGGTWYDVGTTNSSVSGTRSVTRPMYDRNRPVGSSGNCPRIRAVVDYRIDFTSGGSKSGTVAAPGWTGSCF